LSTIGICTQNKARNGVHLRAKSVQRVRAMFSHLGAGDNEKRFDEKLGTVR
jgi:hypothetical protein